MIARRVARHNGRIQRVGEDARAMREPGVGARATAELLLRAKTV